MNTPKYQYVNEEEKFWRHSYNVWLSPITDPICVNADNEQDALDEAVDYAEKQGWEGYFLNDEEEAEQAQYDNVEFAGNHGRAIESSEIVIKQLD